MRRHAQERCPVRTGIYCSSNNGFGRYPTVTAIVFCNCLRIPRPRRPPSKRRQPATKPAVAGWSVEPFGKDHDRAGFSRGKPAFDDFIRARVNHTRSDDQSRIRYLTAKPLPAK